MIQLSQVTHRYPSPNGKEVFALDDVSLTLESGHFVALKGPSGCGKSTLLLITGGLLRPSQGSVTVGDTQPYTLSPDERAKVRAQTTGFVFQQFHLIPYLNVLDNVMAPALASGRNDRQRAEALAEEFGLSHRLKHTPSKLSTGERQRTAMARALYNDPKIILADEPTGNLDPENATLILERLTRFAESGGCVLMVTHDPHATTFAHRVFEMRDGKLLA